MSQTWCTIESDPGVFTELIETFGVEGLDVEEIYSLEQQIDKSYGLIFLFQWVQENDARQILPPEAFPDLFFAKQVIQNACATQAILSVLLNTPGIDLGGTLNEFKQFTMMFDSDCKGLAISNSDNIRQAHNSFAKPEPFEIEEIKGAHQKKGEAFHFIAYIPFQGAVYELDGLKQGPIQLGIIEGDESNWLSIVKPEVERRMARFRGENNQFALMSIGPKKSIYIEKEILTLRDRITQLDEIERLGTVQSATLSDGYYVGDSIEQVREHKVETEVLLSKREADLDEIQQRKKFQTEENQRRRHNYLPLICSLLLDLGSKNILRDLAKPNK